jgi:transcriptional regulator of acetoin/glycerol metabolism
VLCSGDYIEDGDLLLSKLPTSGDTLDVPGSPENFKPCSLAEMERKHILATLKATNWNKSQASTILGIERSTLDRKIRRYELQDQPPNRVS